MRGPLLFAYLIDWEYAVIEIPLTKGMVTLIDDEDFALVSSYRWYAQHTGPRRWYAVRKTPRSSTGGNQGIMLLHRFLMNPPSDLLVDHINGDSLDNRRSNLRLCTPSQNQVNRRPSITNTSGFKGVTFCRDAKCWRAKTKIEGNYKHFGCFSTPEDAARAYDAAMTEHFGEFALTNESMGLFALREAKSA